MARIPLKPEELKVARELDIDVHTLHIKTELLFKTLLQNHYENTIVGSYDLARSSMHEWELILRNEHRFQMEFENLDYILHILFEDIHQSEQKKIIGFVDELLEGYINEFKLFLGRASLDSLVEIDVSYSDSQIGSIPLQGQRDRHKARLLDYLEDGLCFVMRLSEFYQDYTYTDDLERNAKSINALNQAEELLDCYWTLYTILLDVVTGSLLTKDYREFKKNCLTKNSTLAQFNKEVNKVQESEILLVDSDGNNYLMGYHIELLLQKHGIEIAYYTLTNSESLNSGQTRTIFKNLIIPNLSRYGPAMGSHRNQKIVGLLDDDILMYLQAITHDIVTPHIAKQVETHLHFYELSVKFGQANYIFDRLHDGRKSLQDLASELVENPVLHDSFVSSLDPDTRHLASPFTFPNYEKVHRQIYDLLQKVLQISGESKCVEEIYDLPQLH